MHVKIDYFFFVCLLTTEKKEQYLHRPSRVVCVGKINENSDRRTIFISMRHSISYCKYETHENIHILFFFSYENHTQIRVVVVVIFFPKNRVIITNHTPDLLF